VAIVVFTVSALRTLPLSGFFEWKKDAGRKRPFRIYVKDEPIMNVAGFGIGLSRQNKTVSLSLGHKNVVPFNFISG
jgi:putative SOS response-associated peptidase YedK